MPILILIIFQNLLPTLARNDKYKLKEFCLKPRPISIAKRCNFFVKQGQEPVNQVLKALTVKYYPG